ncbi:MAG: hypothetical protein P4M01_04210 [Acidobacteriota bacterium]|nr:hypothetical protein [Acidobacteriota bacterium]
MRNEAGKRLRILLTAACLLSLPAMAQTSVDAPPAQAPVPAADTSSAAADPSTIQARKLLDEMVTALGGDAWLSYATREEQGRGYSFSHGKLTSEGTIYRRYDQYPDKIRQELPQSREKLFLDSGLGLPVPVMGGKSKDIVSIYNGDKGYEITFRGTAAADPRKMEQVIRRRSHSLDVVIRQWLKDPKTLLFYNGRSVADRQMVDDVSLLNGNNDEVSIGIDVHSRLPISVKYSYRDADRYKMEDEVVYGNYRNVSGIQTPFTITRKRDGEIDGQQFLYKVEYNRAYPADFFSATVTYDPEHAHPKEKQ